MIDIKCTHVSMTLDGLAVHFANGAMIEVTNTRDVPELVNIWHPGDEVIMMTRYPADLPMVAVLP